MSLPNKNRYVIGGKKPDHGGGSAASFGYVEKANCGIAIPNVQVSWQSQGSLRRIIPAHCGGTGCDRRVAAASIMILPVAIALISAQALTK